MQYDNFQPFQTAGTALSFEFPPSRYEVWTSGQKLDSGLISNLIIKCNPSLENEENAQIQLIGKNQELDIYNELLLDFTYTSKDRIYVVTIAHDSNIEDYDSYKSFKTFIPPGFPLITRNFKHYDRDEPYCMSVFSSNGQIAKVSFSFGNNPRLLEFYYD